MTIEKTYIDTASDDVFSTLTPDGIDRLYTRYPHLLDREVGVHLADKYVSTRRGVQTISRHRDCALYLVRPTTADEREWVCDQPYCAELVGWHRGQSPSYGSTPREAVERHAGIRPDDALTGSAVPA